MRWLKVGRRIVDTVYKPRNVDEYMVGIRRVESDDLPYDELFIPRKGQLCRWIPDDRILDSFKSRQINNGHFEYLCS